MSDKIELKRDGWTVCFTPLEKNGSEFVPLADCEVRADLMRFMDGFKDYWMHAVILGEAGFVGGTFSGGEYCFRSDPKVYP